MFRVAFCAVFLGLVLTGAALAESKTFDVNVSAGKLDRVNDPVSVPLSLPTALAKAESVMLQDAAGAKLLGQLTAPSLLAQPKAAAGEVARELHFILPNLKSNATAVFKVTISTDASSKTEGFTWQDVPGDYAELKFGSRPVLRYMCKTFDDSTKDKRYETFKVFHHLYDPAGTRFVTNPGLAGGLYPHHRGIYYGFNQITFGDGKKADVWHGTTGDAYQAHEKFLAVEAGPVLGRHRLEIGWHAGKDVFAKEERELTVYNVPGGQLVEFASRLRTTGGKVKLSGDPQHAGFHFRAAQEVAAQTAKQTYFVRPDGPGKPGETRNWDPKHPEHKDLPWNAMSFVLGDQRYTAGYLDKPTNPKEGRYSERDYGRFGSYFEYELTEANPLEVNYRLWLQKGEMKGDDVAALDNNFVKPVTAAVK